MLNVWDVGSNAKIGVRSYGLNLWASITTCMECKKKKYPGDAFKLKLLENNQKNN